MKKNDLKGKVVVITGASSGFGKGAAQAFAESGASLVLAARREDALQETRELCEAAGVKAIVVVTDVSQEKDVENLSARALSEFGRIDIWINNAGIAAIGEFQEVPLADHGKVLMTDLFGTVYGSYFAMRQFHQQQYGTLINISSVLGKMPAPYYASYVAAKYGVVGLGAALRQELQHHKEPDIHVCTVMPMSHDTPFFEHAANYTGHESVPIPPVYDPQKVVDTLLKLAVDPEEEVVVGPSGKVMVAAHQVLGKLVEMGMEKETETAQIKKAPLSPPTPGSLHHPVDRGRGIHRGA
jgi:short-subunit dehydrogenase